MQKSPFLTIIVAATVIPLCLLQTGAVEIRVGLYNSIPDLADDQLQSYKKLVEKETSNEKYTVEAVVDTSKYDPYGNLNEYLCRFDLIEIDTANLAELVSNGLVKEVDNIPENIFPAAVEAVSVGDATYGYPTLLCGNFLVGLDPATEELCPLRQAGANYDMLKKILTECSSKFIPQTVSERLLGGKMNDTSGWYLPFMYLDGYIDKYGRDSVAKGVSEVLQGTVDEELCSRLSWFVDLCSHDGESKCSNATVKGNYIKNGKTSLYADIGCQKTLFLFGFSEKLSEVTKETGKHSYAIISPPLGGMGYLLQFTDALVISEARWKQASEEKKRAIDHFVRSFTSTDFRYKFVTGQDLNRPRARFLLPPNMDFYNRVDIDELYGDLEWALRKAVPAPSLKKRERKTMQKVLVDKCVKRPPADLKAHEEL